MEYEYTYRAYDDKGNIHVPDVVYVTVIAQQASGALAKVKQVMKRTYYDLLRVYEVPPKT